MMRPAHRGLSIVVVALVGACGDNSASWTPYLIGVVEPLMTGTTSISVSGGRFEPSATVFWNGRPQATTVISPTLVHVNLETSASIASGKATLTATNENSYPSAPIEVNVLDAILIVSALDPAFVTVGSPGFTLSVTGAGFTASSVVSWNGVSLQTQFVTSTQLTAGVPSNLAAVPGTGAVTVVNPSSANCIGITGPPCVSLPVACLIGTGRADELRQVSQTANDLAWDAAHGALLLSVPAGAGAHPSSVATLDPAQGTVLASVAAGGPLLVAVAPDGQSVYAALGSTYGPATVTRYRLPDLSVLSSYSPPASAGGIRGLSVAPGSPDTIALTLGGRVFVLDGFAPRPNSAGGGGSLFSSLDWSADGTRLYSDDDQSTGHDLYVISVDANGAALSKTVTGAMLGSYEHVHYDAPSHRVYGDGGEIFDAQGSVLQPVAGSPFGSCVAAVDGSVGKDFLACATTALRNDISQLIVLSFDVSTGAQVGSLLLNSWYSSDAAGMDFPMRLIRWGARGLALASSGGKIYLYDGPFVQ